MCMWTAPRSADRPFAEWNLSVEGEEEGSESEDEKELPNEPGPATEASYCILFGIRYPQPLKVGGP